MFIDLCIGWVHLLSLDSLPYRTMLLSLPCLIGLTISSSAVQIIASGRFSTLAWHEFARCWPLLLAMSPCHRESLALTWWTDVLYLTSMPRSPLSSAAALSAVTE